MNLRALVLYEPTGALAKYHLICLADLAGDRPLTIATLDANRYAAAVVVFVAL